MLSATKSHPFLIGLLAATSVAFFALMIGFWQPIFWAAVIGIIFHPVHTWIAARLQASASLAAVLTVILIFFTVLVPAFLLASAVATEAAGVYARIQSGELDFGAAVRWVQSLLPQAGEWTSRIGFDPKDLTEKLSAAAVKGSQFIATLALSVGKNAASFVLMFFLMLYLLFFVLRDGHRIVQHVHSAIPLPEAQERRLFDKFAEVARATVKGTLVVGMVQGFLGGLIFAILGIQGAVFWGVVMAILSLLPAVGAGLIWVPAAVFLFAAGHWIKGLILVAFGALVIGLVDNLLRPILVGRDTKMPDYLILFSTLGGLGLVGISGFVLGPVIAALFIAAWQIYEEENKAEAAAQVEGSGATIHSGQVDSLEPQESLPDHPWKAPHDNES